MRDKQSSLRPALKGGWKLPYLERHRRRLACANKPGCRKFLQEFAAKERLSLEILRGGYVWLFRLDGEYFAAWLPYDAKLKFSQGRSFHCHDVIQVSHEIRLKLRNQQRKAG